MFKYQFQKRYIDNFYPFLTVEGGGVDTFLTTINMENIIFAKNMTQKWSL